MKGKLKYSVHEKDFEDAYEFETTWDHEESEYMEYVAEDAAEDLHNNHDGFECEWPIEFFIFDLSGKFLGQFSVELDHKPIFSATENKTENVN